ncbi:MAG: electron transfer flavoprotein subunit alpha/FixB family protein [Candidatus Hadarchaeum sp.]|uniref:electron transfer flavoprotein subunit alpha/FixB family protein n=1 Tax=Candidatus Hadarchaeum sp. TaxID=2883567 RepID=UPI00318180A8
MTSWRGIWTIAEQQQGELKQVSFELIARGRGLADKLGVPLGTVLLGSNIKPATAELVYRGADQVFFTDHPALAEFDPDIYANCLERLIREERPDILIAAATSLGRTLMPILAARLKTGLTADCIELDIEDGTGLLLQTRPAVGGNVLVTIKTPHHRPQMATVRPHSYPPSERDLSRTGEIIEISLPTEVFKTRFKLRDFKKFRDNTARIEDADVVICAGRGLGKPDNLCLIRELAKLLGGAVGGTRAVVDQGWLPYSSQIGLSGKTVSPKLYIGCGVSGAIQHLAGMRDSKFIIAINKDPRALIFKVADLGIVSDVNEIIPHLILRLREIKNSV